MKKTLYTAALTALALVVPASLIAQEPAPPAQEMDPEVAALVTEMQEIQQQLAPVQQQVMQDPAIAQQLQEVQTSVEEAMREEDPQLFERLDRVQADLQAAQEAGDQERLQAISAEAQGMQQELQTLQETAIARPEIRQQVDAFEAAQRERMIEIDPAAGDLLDRAEEIQEELMRHQQGATPPQR